MLSVMEKFIPRITDRLMERALFAAQKREGPAPTHDSLFSFPPTEGQERGDHRGAVLKHSAYTAASLHPIATIVALGTAVGAASLLVAGLRRGRISTNLLLGVVIGLLPARGAAKPLARTRPATGPMRWAGTRNLGTHGHLNRKKAA